MKKIFLLSTLFIFRHIQADDQLVMGVMFFFDIKDEEGRPKDLVKVAFLAKSSLEDGYNIKKMANLLSFESRKDKINAYVFSRSFFDEEHDLIPASKIRDTRYYKFFSKEEIESVLELHKDATKENKIYDFNIYDFNEEWKKKRIYQLDASGEYESVSHDDFFSKKKISRSL